MTINVTLRKGVVTFFFSPFSVVLQFPNIDKSLRREEEYCLFAIKALPLPSLSLFVSLSVSLSMCTGGRSSDYRRQLWRGFVS